MLVDVLNDGIEEGELEAHDTRTVAAALIGATGEALVGPLAPTTAAGTANPEALIAAVVQFCANAVPARQPALET